MKHFCVCISILFICCLGTSFAFAGGGTPAKHGIDGKTFGGVVSGTAKSAPGAVADHVTSANPSSGNNGTPSKHGLSGKDFGGAVSGTAKSGPGAIAGHVSNKN